MGNIVYHLMFIKKRCLESFRNRMYTYGINNLIPIILYRVNTKIDAHNDVCLRHTTIQIY